MEPNKKVSEIIGQYIISPNSEKFSKISYLFQNGKIPIEGIEKLVEIRGSSIPAEHIGLFYRLIGRNLEAIYYLSKHLEEHPDDISAWINYQYISAQRGDIFSSRNALIRISDIGKDIDIYRSEVIHLILIGHISDAVNMAKYLVGIKIKDDITVSIIFELCIMSEEWFFIPWLTDIDFGRKLLSNEHGFMPAKVRKLAVERLIVCLQHRIEGLEHE